MGKEFFVVPLKFVVFLTLKFPPLQTMSGLVTRAHRLVPRLVRSRCCAVRTVRTRPPAPPTLLLSEALLPRTISTTSARCVSNVSMLARNEEKIDSNAEATLRKYLANMAEDVQKQRRVLEYEVENVLRLVEKLGGCSYADSLLVLRCCGEVLVDADTAARQQLLQHTIDTLQRCGVTLDINHYNIITKVSTGYTTPNLQYIHYIVYCQVYTENHQPVSVNELLSHLEAEGLTPNRVTLQHCHALLCQQGDTKGAEQLVTNYSLATTDAMLANRAAAHIANGLVDFYLS